MPRESRPRPTAAVDRRQLTQQALRRSLVTRAESSLVRAHDQQPSESPTIEARALAAVLRWHAAIEGTWEHTRATAALCEIADEAEATR